MNFLTKGFVAIVSILICAGANGQNKPADRLNIAERVLSRISSTINSLERKLTSSSEKELKKFNKQELRFKRRLHKSDSTAAEELFGQGNKVNALLTDLKNSPVDSNKVGEFFPYADSLKTFLSFLNENRSLTPSGKIQEEVRQTTAAFNSIEAKLKTVSRVQQHLKERKDFLKSQLQKYCLAKHFKKLDKQVYYYNQKLKEYKSVLNDPKKMEVWTFRALNKIPAFKKYFEENSFVSNVFGLNGHACVSSPAVPDLPGLQTRMQVQQIVNANLVSALAANNQNTLADRLAQVKTELRRFQTQNSSWDENAEMPHFKANEMRGRSFFKKLGLGTDLQFNKSAGALPCTADIGLQLTYKFHQDGSFGFGIAYKLGYGAVSRISFSNQGIGLRSFLDYKLKEKIFVNGGFEFNYNSAFDKVEQLKAYDAWQASALLGISKKYKISRKINGNIILLHDFLYRRHIPNSQPFVFRLGYNF
jgi:hypothetical protein